MNNPRLLIGLLSVVLSSHAMCSYAQSRVYSLEEIFDSAERNSLQLRQSFSAEYAAQRELDAARTERLPEISAALSLGYNGNGFTTARDFTDYQKAPIPHLNNVMTVGVTQPVYTGGAISGAIGLAGQKAESARLSTEEMRNRLRMQLTGLYLDIYKYSNLRGVVEQNIEQAKKVLANMEDRYAQGMALRNDITRYELMLSTMELQLTKTDNTLDILNHNLVEIAGLPEGCRVIPDSTILARALPNVCEADWQNEATDNSPSLRLASNAVGINRTLEKIAHAELMPKVGLQAGWNFNGPILNEVPPINRNISYWFVGVNVSYNLSSLYKSNKRVKAQRAKTIVAADNLETLRQDLSLAVRSEYIRYLEAYQELETQTKAVELASLYYHTVTTRFEEGMTLITDQLDAANRKLQSEEDLVNAHINIIYQYYKLLYTSGKI